MYCKAASEQCQTDVPCRRREYTKPLQIQFDQIVDSTGDDRKLRQALQPAVNSAGNQQNQCHYYSVTLAYLFIIIYY